MIPAPVLGEYLVGCAEATRREQAELIQKSFLVPAFDARAAFVAANLQTDSNVLKQIRKTSKVDWQKLKVDCQIIAIAMIHGAEKIIAHDPHMKTIAHGKIVVEAVPDIPKQLTLQGTRL